MGNQIVTDQQAGFAGGLNATSDPVFLSPDQARVMNNLRLNSYGAALKRLGTHVASTPTIITTFTLAAGVTQLGGGFWPNSGAIALFAPATNSTTLNLYHLTGTGNLTWTSIGACPQFYPVIFSDGTNEMMYIGGDPNSALYKWDGSSAPAATTAPGLAGGLCVYNDRLWGWPGFDFSGSLTTLSNLYFSNLSSVVGSKGGDSLGDSSSAAAGGGVIQVNTFGSSFIIACRPCNGSLLIFHTTGISILTGWGQSDTTVVPQGLNSTIGMGNGSIYGICTGNDLSTGDIVYFVTPLGIYATNGGWVKPLGTPQRPDPVAALLQSGAATPGGIRLAFNRQYNEVWVGVQGTGVYIYSVVLQAWSGPFTGTYANGTLKFFEVLDPSTGLAHLWRICQNGAFGTGVSVSVCDFPGATLDDMTYGGSGGNPITANLQLRRMTSQDRIFAKSWRWLNLLATLQTGDVPPVVTYTTQFGGTNSYTMTNLTSAEKAYYIPVGGEGSYIDATITDPGTAGAATNIYTLASVQGNKLGMR